MKIFINKCLLLVVCLFWALDGFSIPSPPTPTSKKLPPPPPGLPINEDLPVIFAIALLFGIYTIYKYQLKTKTPI